MSKLLVSNRKDGGLVLGEGEILETAGPAIAREGLGAFGTAPPASQPAHIADPAGGATQDAEARTAINAILAVLEGAGLTASS